MLSGGNENGGKVDRFEKKIGEVMAGGKGKRGVRKNPQVPGLHHWADVRCGSCVRNSEGGILPGRRFRRPWRQGCVETDELCLELTLRTPKINSVQPWSV